MADTPDFSPEAPEKAPPNALDVTLAALLGWDLEAAQRLRRELKEIADAEDEAARITRDVRLRGQ